MQLQQMVKQINIKTLLYNKNKHKMKPQTYIMAIVWLAVAVTLVTPFVNAQSSLGVFKQNDQVQLVQTCSICSYITLDSIKYPDGTISAIETNMTKIGSTFYYNFTQTSQLGEYIYNTYYGNWTAPVSFEITITGHELNMETTIVYIVILLFLIGLMCYIGYLYPKLPKNETNSDGYVINASQMTYLRPIAIGFMWLLTMGITYIVANIAIAYLPVAFLGNFLFGLWTIMMYSNLVILPLWVIWIIIGAFRQAKLKEFLERGGMAFG